jgi:hypothetical protein
MRAHSGFTGRAATHQRVGRRGPEMNEVHDLGNAGLGYTRAEGDAVMVAVGTCEETSAWLGA